MQQYLVMQDGQTHSINKDLLPIECFQCGECCIRYRPMLLDEEINRIASKLSISRDLFLTRYVQVMPDRESFILDNGERQCPFLSWDQESGKARCTIYQFRPQAWRNWVASLSEPACQAGLKRLRNGTGILLPKDIYSSDNKITKLYSVLRSREEQVETSQMDFDN